MGLAFAWFGNCASQRYILRSTTESGTVKLQSLLVSTIGAAMKRDMDLIREILQAIEARPDEGDVLQISGRTPKEVNYHIALLKDAGFVEATVDGDLSDAFSFAYVSRLTWQGHEFLDAARDDTIWHKAKEHFLKPTASWTFSLLLEWLKQEAHNKLLGIPPST